MPIDRPHTPPPHPAHASTRSGGYSAVPLAEKSAQSLEDDLNLDFDFDFDSEEHELLGIDDLGGGAQNSSGDGIFLLNKKSSGVWDATFNFTNSIIGAGTSSIVSHLMPATRKSAELD
ncbi:hypothetical protein HK104_010257 [Borealophlyctis nickersoniae]|nr:hypothetical protein HK104_010257 [Borealophlyctis nickersoniae]